MQISGIFIVVKDKESSLEQFNQLKERYGTLQGGYNRHQEVNLCKAYCHDLQSAISFQAGDIASGLYTIIKNSVPIKDFPSCKKLSELSIDDAVSAINDLGKNKILK